jgi:hypothetical protein
MAHSIEIYRGKTTVINDFDLLVVIGFGVELIRQSTRFARFKGLENHWRQSMLQYGPGVIDLKLDQFLTIPDETREFRALLSAILDQASQHGKAIPANVLTELISAPRIRVGTGDYAVSYIEVAIKKLEALLADS